MLRAAIRNRVAKPQNITRMEISMAVSTARYQ